MNYIVYDLETDSAETNWCTILEFGAGKSLEQNIFLSYKSNHKLNQTLIDISNMLDIDLFNKANQSRLSKKNKK